MGFIRRAQALTPFHFPLQALDGKKCQEQKNNATFSPSELPDGFCWMLGLSESRIHQAIQQAIRRQFAGPPTIYQGKTSKILVCRLLPRLETLASDLSGASGEPADVFRSWKTLRAWRCFSPLKWDIHRDIHGDIHGDVMVDGEGSKMIKA